MRGKSWARVYYNILVNLDRGIVLTFTKTGFAWAMLVILIGWDYLKYYPNSDTLRTSVNWIITTWPFVTSLISMGVGFMLNLYSEDVTVSVVRLVSGMFLVLGFIIILWTINHEIVYLTVGLMFIATPLVVRYLVLPWKEEK